MTDPFSAIMGDRRGWQDPRATDERAATAEEPAGPAANRKSSREPGVSRSGLPFQAVAKADVIAAMQACTSDLGRPPSVSQYESWRFQQTAAAARNRVSAPAPPSVTTILRRCGTWRRAIQASAT